ncbi:MAG: D-glycero-beta-D-manno-heptose-7-phosphate kinase [Planctomycetes bacterium]|nr:D-glycero-beta-D-manno-heptose-7-phosphate kinase [Planctomycetota bacterium]
MDLRGRIETLGHPRVLVAGDLILDRYVWGDVERVSPEAPIPVLRVTGEETRLGGAGNVAHNLATLGARVTVAGALGDDHWALVVRDHLRRAGCEAAAVTDLAGRPTTVKTRFIARNQQVLRVDREDLASLPGDLEGEAARVARDQAGSFDMVVVSDYAKGYLTETVVRAFIEAARDHGRRVIVDPKGRDWSRYRGVTVLTPNVREVEEALGVVARTREDIEAAGERIVRELEVEVAAITRGRHGISLVARGQPPVHSPARARAVYDVTGAGDTVTAALALCAACGSSWEEAAALANLAAGVVVGRVGATPVSRAELLAECAAAGGPPVEKVATVEAVLERVAAARREGRRVVFTNGCFDLLHVGHVLYLQHARSLGALLVVGLNSDASIRRLKRAARPVIPQEQRARMLAALECVDHVVLFDEETPLGLIRAVHPDVLVKGADYKDRVVVGRELVESWGGRVELAPYVEGVSTSQIVARISSRETRRP